VHRRKKGKAKFGSSRETQSLRNRKNSQSIKAGVHSPNGFGHKKREILSKNGGVWIVDTKRCVEKKIGSYIVGLGGAETSAGSGKRIIGDSHPSRKGGGKGADETISVKKDSFGV